MEGYSAISKSIDGRGHPNALELSQHVDVDAASDGSRVTGCRLAVNKVSYWVRSRSSAASSASAKQLLHDVSFCAEPGECVAIMVKKLFRKILERFH